MGEFVSKRLFSGVQPTGVLHIGNYLGALQQWRVLQYDIPSLFCVVDLHALTLGHDPEELFKASLRTAAGFIACGIDPERSILFCQSSNEDVPRLNWLLSCVARIGWLNRMTQFKDKAGKDRERASVGLYVYPVLMAADILAFRSTHVPVGEDQKQHIEFTRDVAQKFNHDYGSGDFFPLPEPYILPDAGRVMSLRDGTKKMSKSDVSDGSRINLVDDDDAIYKKIRRAKTDDRPLPDNIDDLGTRPEARNLLSMHAAFARVELGKSIIQFAGKGFSVLKKDLADTIINEIAPIREKIMHLEAEPTHLESVLRRGADRAHEISRPVVEDVYRALGLRKA